MINCILTGVGGQGTVLASKLLASTALHNGLNVRTAETIGMAQRGGSVVSHVRIGDTIYSPLISHGQADIIIGFEPAEAVRCLPYLKPNGIVVVSKKGIAPVTASLQNAPYDESEMLTYLHQHVEQLVVIDGEAICNTLGNVRVLNTVLIGAALTTNLFSITQKQVEATITELLPEKYTTLNIEALQAGITAGNQPKEATTMIQLTAAIQMAMQGAFYQNKYKDIDLSRIETLADFQSLPFTDKGDLRDAYPLGLQAVSDEDVIRIHSSSGTTGTPVIIPYTAKDVEDWALLFKRCYEVAGITKHDRIQITPGYGLWTAGIGFQNGAEKLGAMAIPMGPGNTEKQLKMMADMGTTVLCATSSYALLLAEEIEKRGIKDQLQLKKGVIGSERWGKKMRKRIANDLGATLYDIYGLTELYGPGIAVSCDEDHGMHYWDDYLYFEIIDPKTGELVPYGEIGELVVTTLCKEGAPLIRYRTHDLTRFVPGVCACGCKHPRIDTLIGRTDDMIKIKGVNIFPAQIDELLHNIPDISSEYQVMIDHLNGKDIMTVYFEIDTFNKRTYTEQLLRDAFKTQIGVAIVPKAVDLGELPRSERKSNRIFDNRY